jgi:hypothetical protein
MTWEEHYTGVIATHVENMGVTEFQFIGMGLLLIPTIVGDMLNKVKIYEISLVGIVVIVNALL